MPTPALWPSRRPIPQGLAEASPCGAYRLSALTDSSVARYQLHMTACLRRGMFVTRRNRAATVRVGMARGIDGRRLGRFYQRLGHGNGPGTAGSVTATQELTCGTQTKKIAKEPHGPSPCNGACGNRQEWAGLP